MAKEIERKFLVIGDSYEEMSFKKCDIIQGYISAKKESTVRIRIKDDSAFITIKGITQNISRDEWEYQIPLSDAKEMLLKLPVGNLIEKTRYYINYGRRTWEVDKFRGVHEGLVIAEIEIEAEDENINLPPFVREEVTGNVNYYNSVLSGVNLLE